LCLLTIFSMLFLLEGLLCALPVRVHGSVIYSAGSTLGARPHPSSLKDRVLHNAVPLCQSPLMALVFVVSLMITQVAGAAPLGPPAGAQGACDHDHLPHMAARLVTRSLQEASCMRADMLGLLSTFLSVTACSKWLASTC